MYQNRTYRHKISSHKKMNAKKSNMHFLFVTVLIINIIFIVTGVNVNAKDDSKPLYKYYQSYMVEKGDTLLSIAYDMNVDSCSNAQIQECVKEMISINSLDHKGTICYGNYILVPYYSDIYQ